MRDEYGGDSFLRASLLYVVAGMGGFASVGVVDCGRYGSCVIGRRRGFLVELVVRSF